eukprot:jgi/Tetstr1/443094/TSEL_031150.t1
MRDATQAQLDFMATELPRFEAIGAWERGHCNKWVSRMFLVPKPGTNKWRLIIDLRELNKWCKTFTMSYETLKHLRHLARAGDWFVSMDLADGYYALGIREEDRDFFTVNYRGELWRLACLPMGWTGSSYYFCKLTAAFTDYLRTPLKRRDPALPPTAPSKPTRRFLRNTRWRGERLLPYMDDFLFLADSREAALELRVRLSTLLNRLGLLRNPNKGVWEPTQVGPHLGLIIDLKRGEFRAPEEKLIALAKAAGWGGRVKMTNQLRRDLEWWTQVPAQHNGRSMYKPVETAYLHADSSSYGWGAVLNNNSAYQARGFWYEDDRSHHITWKELRAKGDQRTRVSAKPLINLPIAAVPDFADLLDWYTVSRDAYCRRFYAASPPPKFWSISPLESSATWSVSATLTEWLREAYLAAGARPPTGFKWTSHSLRKGAASAASCVGVPLPAIKHMGDWSKNSEVVTGKYIDPTMRPTPAAWRFFGWLVPVRPPA